MLRSAEPALTCCTAEEATLFNVSTELEVYFKTLMQASLEILHLSKAPVRMQWSSSAQPLILIHTEKRRSVPQCLRS